jgi:hypothetical protein
MESAVGMFTPQAQAQENKVFIKNGPVLVDYNFMKKKKLKYAFAVGIYEFQKARVL